MPRKKKHHVCGDKVCFHGAFKSKAKAQEKARSVNGRVKFSLMGRNGARYLVLTKKG